MATKSAKSTRDYGLWYGISVGGLDKDSGIKLSEEIANLLETDGSKCYEAADFILDNSLLKQAVFNVRYGKGVNPQVDNGGDKVFCFTTTGATLNGVAEHVKFIGDFRKNQPAKQIAGSKAVAKRGGGGGIKRVFNFNPAKKVPVNVPAIPQPDNPQ